MRANYNHILILAGVALVNMPFTSSACTNFLITKGATTDGSTMITYSADSHEMYGDLYHVPARTHGPDEMLDVYEWDTKKYLGQIKQVPETYGVVGNMNEHQVAIGETTFGGREELKNPKGGIDYGSLMYLALQRAKTAREAVQIMGALVEEYGYCSEGESFSISDPQEVWIMEMIGKGPERKGALWVARRVPDGYVCAHANHPRITTFPLNDKKNTLYAPDVISFAREKKYFSGPDKEFSFADTYAPMTYKDLRICELRVWSMFRRVSVSAARYLDWVKGVETAERLPIWIKPDKKLSVHDVMQLMRDHFEGSEFDLSKGVGAGPFQLPYRWRPLYWKVDGVEYVNDRSTSTQQTGFSFVTQSRSFLPDPIGGVLWFGVDDTFSTVYVPMYCGITEAPINYAVGTGDFHHFTWDSAFWVFNFVANYAYSRYRDMIKDIQVVQRELEGSFLSQQQDVESAALELFKRSPRLARDYLTDYSKKQAAITVKRWRHLGESLIVKYLDGNVRDSNGVVTHPEYPTEWYRRIVRERGEFYKARRLKNEPPEKPAPPPTTLPTSG